MTSFPRPGVVSEVFGVTGDFRAELAACRFGKLHSRSTIVARVFRGGILPDLQAEADDAADGRPTGRFLTIPQYLAEQGPQHNGGVFNVLLAEQPAVLTEDSNDLLGGQDGSKWQSRLKQESIEDLLKPDIPEIVGIRYGLAHEKPFLASVGTGSPERACDSYRRRNFSIEGPQIARGTYFHSRDDRPDYALSRVLTVPFRS